MNKYFCLLLALFSLLQLQSQSPEELSIGKTIDQWHLAAGEANFETYFGLLDENSIFIGTDASEVWNKQEFMAFSKPYFEQGKAWDFKAIKRNIYIDPSGNIAWFDELLDTWMQLCRGSGVLKKVDGKWKIAHYVLSLTVPNEEIEPVIALKKKSDSTLMMAIPRKK